MPSRLLAFFLALVLAWSGLSAWEPLGAILAAERAAQSLVAEPGDRSAGTVADHHLDDQPSQFQGNPVPDLTGLPAPVPAIALAAVAAARPRLGESPALPAPCLAHPERPPRSPRDA